MLATGTRFPRARAVMAVGLDESLHRCLQLARPFGSVHLLHSNRPAVRAFLLDVSRAPQLRWTLRSVDAGTELIIERSVPHLKVLGRHQSSEGQRLGSLLALLSQTLTMKIVVIGGGTGLYTTLLGLRDRSWSLTAIISGLSRAVLGRDSRDQLGALPRDDASLSLVALAPTVRQNIVLRSLLTHRMESLNWRGQYFGDALLDALEETSGTRQAGLDTAAAMLGISGRILIGLDGGAGGGVAAIGDADMVVIAPGQLELDVMPVLCCPGLGAAIQNTPAVKVVVTPIMTVPGEGKGSASQYVHAVARMIGGRFDGVIMNQGVEPSSKLRQYLSDGAHPFIPDVEPGGVDAHTVFVKALSADGDLARHDPDRLAECLLEVGALQMAKRAKAAS